MKNLTSGLILTHLAHISDQQIFFQGFTSTST